MAREAIVDDDGVIIEHRVKVSGLDEAEYWEEFVHVHNNSPITTLQRANEIAKECKTYAESMLKSNALKDADRPVLERQSRDARNLLGGLWAIELHAGKVPKKYQESLRWALVEAFNAGRHFERLQVRPAGPPAKIGKERRRTSQQEIGKVNKAAKARADNVIQAYERLKKQRPNAKKTELIRAVAKQFQSPRQDRRDATLSPRTVQRILTNHGILP